MVKCVSECTKLNEQTCNTNAYCNYVNGASRKYCGLSSKYKMNPLDCSITKKNGSPIKGKTKKMASPVAPPVPKPVKGKTKKLVILSTKLPKNKKYQDTIARFLKKSSLFLKTICLQSGECLAFGKNTGAIKDFFNGFTGFEYAVSPIKSIGEDSANGFVKEIKYSRQGYDAYAILKSSKRERSDNLMYEGLVGTKFINRMNPLFPCFLETYATYYYSPSKTWGMMKKDNLDKNMLSHLKLQTSIDYGKACKKSLFVAILLQHIKGAQYIDDLLKKDNVFIINHLLYLLFIVYQTLASLSKEFTHYDLHFGNVFFVPLEAGKYIEYHYHNANGTVTQFAFPGIPKIIDYGRSFFDNQHVSSKEIYDQVCKEPKCKPGCGDNVGFTYLADRGLTNRGMMQTVSQRKNESHDLRLLNNVKLEIPKLKVKPNTPGFVELEKIANKVLYGQDVIASQINYGTKENLKKDDKINNVTDAYINLKAAVETPAIIDENRKYHATQVKIADLHIYHDRRPMVFERK